MLAQNHSDNVILVIESSERDLLQEERADPGPGPELFLLRETQAGGERSRGEEVILQQVVNTGEHGPGDPPHCNTT